MLQRQVYAILERTEYDLPWMGIIIVQGSFEPFAICAGAGDSTMKTIMATGGNMLAKIATPLRASNAGSPSIANATGSLRRKSFLSSITSQLTPRGRSSHAGDNGTPLRLGSMAWTPRGKEGR